MPSILNEVPTRMMPPTFYRLNKFTRGLQNLVESYGVADYLEVNPGTFILYIRRIVINIVRLYSNTVPTNTRK